MRTVRQSLQAQFETRLSRALLPARGLGLCSGRSGRSGPSGPLDFRPTCKGKTVMTCR